MKEPLEICNSHLGIPAGRGSGTRQAPTPPRAAGDHAGEGQNYGPSPHTAPPDLHSCPEAEGGQTPGGLHHQRPPSHWQMDLDLPSKAAKPFLQRKPGAFLSGVKTEARQDSWLAPRPRWV